MQYPPHPIPKQRSRLSRRERARRVPVVVRALPSWVLCPARQFQLYVLRFSVVLAPRICSVRAVSAPRASLGGLTPTQGGPFLFFVESLQ